MKYLTLTAEEILMLSDKLSILTLQGIFLAGFCFFSDIRFPAMFEGQCKKKDISSGLFQEKKHGGKTALFFLPHHP